METGKFRHAIIAALASLFCLVASLRRRGRVSDLIAMYHKASETCANVKVGLLGFLLAMVPTVGTADIIWSGDFSTGDFTQWHRREGPPTQNSPADELIQFPQMPAYGRPIQYGLQNIIHVGNGDLCSLVSVDGRSKNGITYPRGPTRGSSPYALKLTVKSGQGGGVEPENCDNGICERRRTGLSMQSVHSDYYNAMPYQQISWFSFSIYVPADFHRNQTSWGGPMMSVKPKNDAGGPGNSGAFTISAQGKSWHIVHRWDDRYPVPDLTQIPYWQSGQYTMDLVGEDHVPFPDTNFVPDLLGDYPDVAASQAALADLNLGGWTDWVVQWRPDARSAANGGSGFINVWKRAGDGPWVQVLNIVPRVINYSGKIVDRGIGYNVPATVNNGGYGLKAQIYLSKDAVWNDPVNKVAYYANTKIGDENATFSDMSPDGSGFSDMSPDGSGNFGESGSGGGSTGIPMIVFLLVWGMWQARHSKSE